MILLFFSNIKVFFRKQNLFFENKKFVFRSQENFSTASQGLPQYTSMLFRMCTNDSQMAGRGDGDENKWHAFAKKMAVKRDINKKRKSLKDSRRDRASVENDFIMVQRLSGSVSGKAQKFCCLGPREFVPYSRSDLTIEGIKEACNQHFRTKTGTGFFSYVLAGEQGPPCNL